MSEKHDRTAPRKVEDLERKYNFGKKFAEILGLIDESRDKMDSVESGLRNEIKETSTSLSRDTEKLVFEATETIKEDGVTKVQTTTGFRFDADGLNISKSGEEMENLLDNTGMYVRRSGEDILVANNEGVKAANLHAITGLIIGSGSGRCRIEDYGEDRVGAYWIGI